MSYIKFHKNFKKQYQRLNKTSKDKFEERLIIFSIDEFNPVLNNHALKGNYKGYRSINIIGDIRAIYEMKTKNHFIFIAIDNYNNLYK